jgi:hypothetical protein
MLPQLMVKVDVCSVFSWSGRLVMKNGSQAYPFSSHVLWSKTNVPESSFWLKFLFVSLAMHEASKF